MADIEVRVRGIQEVLAGYRGLEPEKMIETGLYQTAVTMYTDLRTYPPELPNQRYRRTFKLRNGWFVIGGGLLMRVMNDTNAYNRAVQDRDEQRRIFQGRWTTWQDVVERRAPEARENVWRAVEARMHGV